MKRIRPKLYIYHLPDFTRMSLENGPAFSDVVTSSALLGGAILCALLFGDPNPDRVDWKKNMSAEKGLILRSLSEWKVAEK